MINKDEILAFADETGLTPNVVEKDYLPGWLLAAINRNPVLWAPLKIRGAHAA